MFGLFKKDPVKALRKKYDILLEQAMHAQRNGNIRLYSELSYEAELLWKKIEGLQK